MTRFLRPPFPFYLLAADNSIRGFPPARVAAEQAWEAKAQATPDPQRVRNTIQKLADKPHLAGTPASKAVADYLAGQLREWGLETHIEEFDALLPTPQHRVLEMTEPKAYRARLHRARRFRATRTPRTPARSRPTTPTPAMATSRRRWSM